MVTMIHEEWDNFLLCSYKLEDHEIYRRNTATGYLWLEGAARYLPVV